MAEILTKRGDLTTVTPMMQQYLDVKNQYPDYVLMYRLGDFYECFFEDAVAVSKAVDLTLTARDCGDGKRAAMCGVPFHKYDLYVNKLVENGFKVAVCEQMEDPKSAVGLVKRQVTRVVTPGTVTDDSILNRAKNNYLVAVCFAGGRTGIGFADISTGEVSSTCFREGTPLNVIESEIGAYSPSEIVLNVPERECHELCLFLNEKYHTFITDDAARLFAYEPSLRAVRSVWESQADALTEPASVMAVGALLAYIKETQKTDVAYVRSLNVYGEGQFMELDYNTRRNLELTETMRNKERKGSLLWVLDRTKTAMGARMLSSWLLKPLRNPVQIGQRQQAVSDFMKDTLFREELREALGSVLDIERLTARSVYGNATAKDLRALAVSLEILPEVKEAVAKCTSGRMKEIAGSFDALEDICDVLKRGIVDNPPGTVREGGMIRDGFNEDIDYYRSVRENASSIMAEIEQRERELTGIKTLRVDFNKVFGYYIEVTKSLTGQVPDRYVRKQTLTNCERYITQEIKEMESTIFGAAEKLSALEYQIFDELRQMVVQNCERIRTSAALVAQIDVFSTFAEVAQRNSYVCPEVDLSTELTIRDGRHPVVEKFVSDSYFVPNDTQLDTSANRLMIITGPNMAGKSTYMRQVALIAVMAQIGSYVPATEAHIGIVDKVFTRVGASDDLASGQSTFMLEMNEVAAILKNATKRSLIVYDEVGRGTSTYDGMAIARAVVEYTHSKKIGARTLFATHYHELTSMEEEYPGIVNYNIAARKRGDNITFLRKIVRGGTDDSYGIEVAGLAGVPNEVVRRAREILAKIESDSHVSAGSGVKGEKVKERDLFEAFVATKDNEAADRIRKLDLNVITPIEAMNLLFELKKFLSE